jgi:hypothetical protein
MNITNSTRGIDMTVQSYECDTSGNAKTATPYLVIRTGLPTYSSILSWTTKANIADSESEIGEVKITNMFNGTTNSVTPMYKTIGYSNGTPGLTPSTDDYMDDKFYNIENLVGTNYDDKVTMLNSNWGFRFNSSNGKDSMYGGSGADTLDFRKNATLATYGGALDNNTLVGGFGADTFILNEKDMVNSTNLARNFKVYGDEIGSYETPIFRTSGLGVSNNFYTPDSYVDEIRLFAQSSGGTIDLTKFIGNIDRVEKIDISQDSLASTFVLTGDLIRGLADNGNNSTIIVRLKSGVDKLDTTALTNGGYTIPSTNPRNPSYDIQYETYTFSKNNVVQATAYVEYVL